MHELFDFLRWALSDFWRFAGLAVLMLIVGLWTPRFYWRTTPAEVKRAQVSK